VKIYESGAKELGKISGLYQGDAMSGKTHMICTWPGLVLFCFDPDTQTARKMPGVHIVELESFAEYEEVVVPYIKNRSVHELVSLPEDRVQSVGIDTISLGSTYLAREIQGTRGNMTQQDFGLFLNKLTSTTMQCVEATREREDGAPSYNVLFGAHLKTVTDAQGNVVGIRPAIMGQFAGLLPRLVGFNFLCEHVVRSQMRHGQPTEEIPVWQVRTVPKSDLYVCGDRIGGGHFNRLPAVCPGTYPELVELWGLDKEGGGETE
jgi:hypothetical protein